MSVLAQVSAPEYFPPNSPAMQREFPWGWALLFIFILLLTYAAWRGFGRR